jgi:ribonucleoside-diphosphate reductase alpha chain
MSETSQSSFDDGEMYVTKRNGKQEIVSFDKILQRIKKVGTEVGIKINYTALAMKVIDQLYNNISTREIDELTAQQCASLSSTHPDYNVLAGRITVSNHQRNTDSSFSKVMSQLYGFTDIHGKPSPLISKELHQNIHSLGVKKLNSLCDYSRDYLIDFFGFKTLERAYLMKINKKIVERPQHMWLRVAIGIHGTNWDKVAETYHYMSQKFFTHATPTLFNAGTPNPQLSSCYLMAMEHDSIDGIFNTLKDCALISKWAGGIGLHIHNVRATGSHIRGTNGTSNGIVPMLKVFNNTAKYVDQCVSPETWIYTTNGPQQISNVVANRTEIFNETGGTEVIQNVLEHPYEGEILKISTDYSIEPLLVTGEHPLYVLSNPDNHVYSTLKNKIDNKTTEVSYIDAKDVCVGDYLVYSIPTYEQDVSHITTEDCSMYGILLNYGELDTHKKEYTISIPNKINDSESTVDFCKSYIEKKSVTCTVKTMKDKTVVSWKPNASIPFRYSDIYNKNDEKYISPIWMNLPLEKIKHIIHSVFSTYDYDNNKILYNTTSDNHFYSTTSREFVEGLRYMMLRLGILSKCKTMSYNYYVQCVYKLKPNYYSAESPYFCIKQPKSFDKLILSENSTRFIHNNQIFCKVNNIERSTYDGILYDLQMPTVHNYMIHNGVVHNGGGKRNGSFAIYLEPWHSDIEMFLQMRKNHGDEELKARDLFYALWTPDLFMQRVKANANWTLFCPSECPGLSDVYGKEFETLYTKYENEGKGRKTMPARDLWFQILDAQMETGTPYLLYKDAANEKSNQKNLGTIKSSNLCVAPETLVLTDVGQFPICSLWAGNYPECEQEKRQYTNVWNGETFSRVEVKKTATCNTEFVKVRTNDGECLTCTPYHKFYIVQNGETKEVQASDLQSGMTLETSFYPVIDSSNNEDCEHISKRHDAEHLGCMSGMKNMALNGHNLVTDPPIFVPINHSLKTKLDWFAGFIEPFLSDIEFEYEDLVEVPSRSIVLLQDIKHMLQTCGVNVIVNILQKEGHPDLCSMHIRVGQIKQLMQQGMEFKIPYIKTSALTVQEFEYTPTVQIVDVETIERIDDTYCFTEPLKHAGIFNGIRTGQCTEIIEYSDDKETAVCNLASIALPAFIRKPNTPEEESRTENGLIFDYEMLHEVTKVVTGNLNRIIDVNYYPTEKTRVSNMRHRPIGIGIQGLADVFLQLGWTFSSEKSKKLNKQAFETIYHASLERSCELAEIEGPYETFQGSPASKGILQFDMWDINPESNMYDWDALRRKVRDKGIRNSLLLAPMPTASTSQILGYNECMEPITSNIYSRRTLAGEFILVNKYLMHEMLQLGLWNETLKNHMVANNGSIQNIEYIPQEVREKYKTVWEIPMKDLIDMSADRGAYICQSQSLNLWLEDPDYKTMTSMHFYSWSKGLKTGIYYLRRRPRHQAQQFTIEPEKQGIRQEEEICEMCSA